MKLRQIFALAAVSATFIQAAPGLTVNNTAFQYNGDTLFFSGMNLAWINYNSDVADDPLDENAWRKAVQDVRAAGGNSIRWWLFNNMSTSPQVNTTTHLVEDVQTSTIANMQKALDIAEEYGVMVSMCLFSHNLMEPCQWGNYANAATKTACDAKSIQAGGTALGYSTFPDFEANQKLLTLEGTNAFITNALTPVVDAIGNHPALMSWEVINEGEGMVAGEGWTSERITRDSLIAFTGRIAAAIHNNPNANGILVSTGVVNAKYLKWYNDTTVARLSGIAAAQSKLDFLQIHYYPFYQDEDSSPFHNTYDEYRALWEFEPKPLVVGEFPAQGWNSSTATAGTYRSSNTTTEQCYRFPFENGYAGSMAWDISGFTDSYSPTVVHNIDDAVIGMEALWETDSIYLKIKNYVPELTSGNGVMEVTYSSVVGSSGARIEYLAAPNNDLTGKVSFSFKIRTTNSSPALSVRSVVKSHEGNNWYWSEGAMCDVPASGEWVTCTQTFATMSSAVYLSAVHSFLIQTFTDGYSGTIEVDDFIVNGPLVITNFDTQFDVFNVTPGGTAITNITTKFYAVTPTLAVPQNGLQAIRFQHGVLSFSTPNLGMGRVLLLNLQGQLERVLYEGKMTSGAHQLPIDKISKGVHLVVFKYANFDKSSLIAVQ